MRFSVVVPAFRDAERIAETVTDLRTALAGVASGGGVEVIVVDDGSGDGTAAAARAAGADDVVEFERNRGKGAAVRAGMRRATGDAVAFTDADLAYPPRQLQRLLEVVESGADVVIGDRRHPDSVAVTAASRVRSAGSRAVGVLRWGLRLGRGRDTQCGIKAFSAAAASRLVEASVMDRFAFDVEMLYLADRFAMTVREVPVKVVNSDQTTVRALSDGCRLALDMCRIRVRALLGRYPDAAARSARQAAGETGAAQGPGV